MKVSRSVDGKDESDLSDGEGLGRPLWVVFVPLVFRSGIAQSFKDDDRHAPSEQANVFRLASVAVCLFALQQFSVDSRDFSHVIIDFVFFGSLSDVFAGKLLVAGDVVE